MIAQLDCYIVHRLDDFEHTPEGARVFGVGRNLQGEHITLYLLRIARGVGYMSAHPCR